MARWTSPRPCRCGGSTTTLSEDNQAGFTAGDVTCVADGKDDQTGTAGSVEVTVHKGETWTCTFENSLNTARSR